VNSIMYESDWDTYLGQRSKELEDAAKVPEPPELYGQEKTEGVVQGVLDYVPNTRDLCRDSEILANLGAIICNLIDSADARGLLPIDTMLRNISYHCSRKQQSLLNEAMIKYQMRCQA
jgi:hypothetical protein